MQVIERLKIAYKHNVSNFKVTKSKFNKMLLENLVIKGYISSYKIDEKRKNYVVIIKMESSFRILFSRLRFVSSFSKYQYNSFLQLRKLYKPSDFFLVLTSRGLFSSEDVFFFKIGGIVLCDCLNYK